MKKTMKLKGERDSEEDEPGKKKTQKGEKEQGEQTIKEWRGRTEEQQARGGRGAWGGE